LLQPYGRVCTRERCTHSAVHTQRFSLAITVLAKPTAGFGLILGGQSAIDSRWFQFVYRDEQCDIRG
jgi:hypothetical protein